MPFTFTRKFENFDFQKMSHEEIYKLIEPEIRSGEIYPALRDDRIDFYYNGECIYHYENNGFSFNPEYFSYFDKKYMMLNEHNDFINGNINFEKFHKDLKTAITKKFSSDKNDKKERSYLKSLYPYTYSQQDSTVKVLDIEVYIDGTKCDMVLWDTRTNSIQFVEAKLYDDGRLWGKKLDTVKQIQKYNNAIKYYKQDIIIQYRNYIDFMEQFGLKTGEIEILNPSVKLVMFDVKRARFDNNDNKGRKDTINSVYRKILKDDYLYLCFDTDSENITPDLIFDGHYE